MIVFHSFVVTGMTDSRLPRCTRCMLFNAVCILMAVSVTGRVN